MGQGFIVSAVYLPGGCACRHKEPRTRAQLVPRRVQQADVVPGVPLPGQPASRRAPWLTAVRCRTTPAVLHLPHCTCRTGLLDDAYQLNRLDLVGPSTFLNLTTALAARLRVRVRG